MAGFGPEPNPFYLRARILGEMGLRMRTYMKLPRTPPYQFRSIWRVSNFTDAMWTPAQVPRNSMSAGPDSRFSSMHVLVSTVAGLIIPYYVGRLHEEDMCR